MATKIESGKMKAVRMYSRGGPENLVFEEVDIPSISVGEALIKVYAASITPTELTWNSSYSDIHGKERFPVIPSFEISGKVQSVSDDVKNLKIGDEVYGLLNFWRDGGAAEYVAIEAANIALKPFTIDHVSAASLPLSGLTAWQALFDYGNLSEGQSCLIHGAAGGVGSLAVQLAHWRKANVIATCSRGKEAIVRQFGADKVLDYNSVKFEDVVREVDLVLDTVGGETLNRSYRTVKKGGMVVSVADDTNEDLERKYGVKGTSMLVKPDGNELREIARLVDSGIVKPVVQGTYPLSRAKDAFISGIAGHNTGKIVLIVSQ